MLEDLAFDFSLFEDVPPPRPRTAGVYRLSLSAEDRLSQNEPLHRALQGAADFHLQVSADGRLLRLDPKGPHNLNFTPAGVRTHHPLGEKLREKGLETPLSYLMCWREDLDCWVGQYDGLTAPPLCLRPSPGNAGSRRTEHETPPPPLPVGISLGERGHQPALCRAQGE